jgi:hypothetical protein
MLVSSYKKLKYNQPNKQKANQGRAGVTVTFDLTFHEAQIELYHFYKNGSSYKDGA